MAARTPRGGVAAMLALAATFAVLFAAKSEDSVPEQGPPDSQDSTDEQIDDSEAGVARCGGAWGDFH